jgi:hypothetical protein
LTSMRGVRKDPLSPDPVARTPPRLCGSLRLPTQARTFEARRFDGRTGMKTSGFGSSSRRYCWKALIGTVLVQMIGEQGYTTTGDESRGDAGVDLWTGYTPAGQRVTVRRDGDAWAVSCVDGRALTAPSLRLALIDAVRGDVQAHWYGVDLYRWTAVVADTILSTWQNEK